MRLSALFTRTSRADPKDEVSANAKLLERGGFVFKNSAGIYTFLPLGWRVMQKISEIIRQEMNKIGGVEMFMPALISRKYMETTGRWGLDVGFKVGRVASGHNQGTGSQGGDFVLGWTHEEVITAIATRFVSSYKDLPFAVYQIQTKFRDEPRAKSGLLRGREFMMKDLYSFHANEDDFWRYYNNVKVAYNTVFHRCGLKAVYTIAAGGDFTVSDVHEFQVVCPVGEDAILLCSRCEYAENKEISKLKNGASCPQCEGAMEEKQAIEVGNIFPLGTKYSQAFNLKFLSREGASEHVIMGSYGIGLGRLMATAVEMGHDKDGIIWPESIAPFRVHLIALDGETAKADEIYEKLFYAENIEVLYDDRAEISAGEKFADADLIGCPFRVVVSKKTLEKDSVEVKKRGGREVDVVGIDNVNRVLL